MESTKPDTQTDYQVERLDHGRVQDLKKLFLSVYHRGINLHYLQAKYDTGYTGVSHIGYLAYGGNGEVAAYYGVIPCFARQGEMRVLCAQSCDTMTHPNHRNKGLFLKLATLCFDLCIKAGIRFLFGFPNQNSLPGFVKLGWKGQDTMMLFRVPVKGNSLESRFNNHRFTRWLYQRYKNKVLRKFLISNQGFPNHQIRNAATGIDRDERYLNYKTYSPSQTIRINGINTWVKIQNGFLIGDVQTPQGETKFEEWLAQCCRLAKRLGCSSVEFQCTRRAPVFELFSKKVAPVSSFPIIYLDFGNSIELDKLDFTLADIDFY